MKFSHALFFLANLVACVLLLPPKEVPCPENATYAGGGGGVYFSPVLSLKLTDNPPLGYFFFNSLGIKLK